MTTPSQTCSLDIKLALLTRHSPVVAGAVVLGAGLTAPMDAGASMVIYDINETLDPGPYLWVDINEDSFLDFGLKIREEPPLAYIDGATNNFGKNYIKNYVVKETSPFVTQLEEGDEVNEGLFTNNWNFGDLYNSEGGPWSTVGDHGFVGLKFAASDGGSGYQWHFGWLELTRGSLEIGRAGWNDEPGASAPIPRSDVPEPGSLLLLASGAAGLLVHRRRRMARAQV